MKIILLIDDKGHRLDDLRDDINAFLLFQARGGCRLLEEDATEEKDGDDEDEPEPVQRTRLTVEFDDALDAADFLDWRDIRRHVRRS